MRGKLRDGNVHSDQYESAPSTSPPDLVPNAHHVGALMVSLMNLTEPSVKQTLTPPGWLLVAVIIPVAPPHSREPGPASSLREMHEMPLGGMKWVYAVLVVCHGHESE